MMTADGVREALWREILVEMSGGISGWAKRRGISPAYVTDVLHGRREPGKKICDALGFRRVIAYEPKTD